MKEKKPMTSETQVYDCALGILGSRDYSDKALAQKLERKGAAPEQAAAAIRKLTDYGILNERRYAQRVYEAWLAKRCYGRLHLAAELAKKRIRPELAQEVLAQLTPEEEAERAEVAACLYVNKNRQKLEAAFLSSDSGNDGGQKQRQKRQKLLAAASRFMASHGFSSRYMCAIIEKLRFYGNI